MMGSAGGAPRKDGRGILAEMSLSDGMSSPTDMTYRRPASIQSGSRSSRTVKSSEVGRRYTMKSIHSRSDEDRRIVRRTYSGRNAQVTARSVSEATWAQGMMLLVICQTRTHAHTQKHTHSSRSLPSLSSVSVSRAPRFRAQTLIDSHTKYERACACVTS